MRVLLASLAVLAAACTPPAEPAPAPVLVTVFHSGGEAEAEALGLVNTWGLSGPADGYTAADLARLPASVIETGYPQGGEAASWSGPRLSTLLAAIDAPDAGARLTAVDGYQVEVTRDEIEAHEPVLATHRDGEPLALGGLGPAILVWPRDTDPELAGMSDDRWPWGVFAVEALADG